MLEQREPNVQGWEKLLTVPSPCQERANLFLYLPSEVHFPWAQGVGVRVS